MDHAMAKALQEAPLAMFDAMSLDKMAQDHGLEASAGLLGSSRIEDYERCEIAHFPQDFSHSLIYAEDAESVGIEGPGRIDGQGRSFPHGAENFNAEDMDKAQTSESFPRPVMARFENCRNVVLDGVIFQNGASTKGI